MSNELTLLQARLTARAKLMLRARDVLMGIRDDLDDEGDRVYFGSTNHAELFKDMAEEFDGWAWDDIMADSRKPDLIGDLAAAREEIRKLQAFKDYVHERLDDAGIPTHPEGEHSKAGCRVGDRLDIALEQWPEWAEKLLRLLESWGAEYDADDEINLPDELAEWLHHYASDIKQAAERKRIQKVSGT